jgi:Trk K+ transport system NAD-binding subunit
VTEPLADPEDTQELPESWRFIVCGDDSLALRLAQELVHNSGQVTVLIRPPFGPYGRRIAREPNVEVVEVETTYTEALKSIDIATVDAVALVERNDVANIDTALAVHEYVSRPGEAGGQDPINPRLRMVVRLLNTSLSGSLAEIPDCTVLSDAQIAAPAFVAAALDEPAPAVHMQQSTLIVTRRDPAYQRAVLCGLAIGGDGTEPQLLPADQDAADLVLLRRELPPPMPRRSTLTSGYPVSAVITRVLRRLRIVLAVFAGLIVLTAAVLASADHDLNWWDALYAAILVAFGNGEPNSAASTVEQVTVAVMTLASITLIPVLTATVVDAVVKVRLDIASGLLGKRASGHVVVVGLGGVGGQVLQTLHERGIDVVGIDRSNDAVGVQVARDLHIPLVIGEASRRETLQAASVATCQALMVITSDDVSNLQTALVARGIQKDLRVVLRLFDGEMADRVRRLLRVAGSHSVSYLAAPSFAARMLGRELDTIPIGRHVLLVARLTVGAYSPLEYRTVRDVRRPGEAWLCELTTQRGQRMWNLTPGQKLQRGYDMLVVATRRGLSKLIVESTAPPDSVPRPPIVLHDSVPLLSDGLRGPGRSALHGPGRQPQRDVTLDDQEEDHHR